MRSETLGVAGALQDGADAPASPSRASLSGDAHAVARSESIDVMSFRGAPPVVGGVSWSDFAIASRARAMADWGYTVAPTARGAVPPVCAASNTFMRRRTDPGVNIVVPESNVHS